MWNAESGTTIKRSHILRLFENDKNAILTRAWNGSSESGSAIQYASNFNAKHFMLYTEFSVCDGIDRILTNLKRNGTNCKKTREVINFKFKIKCSIQLQSTRNSFSLGMLRIFFLLHLLNCVTKFIIIYTRFGMVETVQVFICMLVRIVANKHFIYLVRQRAHNLQLHLPEPRKKIAASI